MSGHRDWNSPSEEHQPVTWWNGYPIFASHLIVIIYCVLMIVTAFGGAAMGPVLAALEFDSRLVWSGQVWRIFSYGLFNYPSLWFGLDMLMLVWFGRELERTFGRRVFFLLYGSLYVIGPVVLSLIGLLRPTSMAGQPGTLGLFVAFATQFPNLPIFFALLAKWAAVILIGLYSLMALSARNWTALVLLWSTCGYAFLFIRHQQGLLSLPKFRWRKRTAKLRVLPDLPKKKPVVAAKPAKEDATMAEVDALLDKIAKSGMASLTPKERAKLEAAREGLMKRGLPRD